MTRDFEYYRPESSANSTTGDPQGLRPPLLVAWDIGHRCRGRYLRTSRPPVEIYSSRTPLQVFLLQFSCSSFSLHSAIPASIPSSHHSDDQELDSPGREIGA